MRERIASALSLSNEHQITVPSLPMQNRPRAKCKGWDEKVSAAIGRAVSEAGDRIAQILQLNAGEGCPDDATMSAALDELRTLLIRVVAADRISDRAPSTARQRHALQRLLRRRSLTMADFRRQPDALQLTIERHFPGGQRAILRDGVRPDLFRGAIQHALEALPKSRGRPLGTFRIAPRQLALGLSYVFSAFRGADPTFRTRNPASGLGLPPPYGPFYDFACLAISILRPHMHVPSAEVVSRLGVALFKQRRHSPDSTARFVFAGALPRGRRRARAKPSPMSLLESRVREALANSWASGSPAEPIVRLVLDHLEPGTPPSGFPTRPTPQSAEVVRWLLDRVRTGAGPGYVVVDRYTRQIRVGGTLGEIAGPGDFVLDLADLLELKLE